MDDVMHDSPDEGSIKAASVIETTEIDELGQIGSSEPTLSFDGTAGQTVKREALSHEASTSPELERRSPYKKQFHNSVLRAPVKDGQCRAIGVRVPAPRFRPLPYSTSRTGLVFDVRMRHHMDQTSSDDDAHPEKPQRIFEIYHQLREAGLLVVGDDEEEDADHEFKMHRIAIREADPSEICLVHSRQHFEYVKSSESVSMDEIRRRTEVGEGESSIYWHSLTYMCAMLAAGGAIEATRAVVWGLVRNAVAIIRPPGHHAEYDTPGGFCFFDNVAIAARVVQEDSKESETPYRKILVLDWDVHHGNGVQQAFYNNPNVLYISLHVHQDGHFYPHGSYGNHLHWGEGPGEGMNVNIPWIDQGMRDADYILAFQQIVMPIAAEFDPDLVMISAGFDAAAGDPLGQCFVTPAGYAHMTHMLMQLANGKVVACLEGGYNLRSTAVSALAVARTLMGEPPERVGELTPTPSAVQTIQTVIQTHSQFWKCLHPKVKSVESTRELESERLHDVIREWQSKILWENYDMSEMTIRRAKISKSCRDQVLATPTYSEDRPLLVIFHDPPEVLGVPDPRTSRFELHNTFLTDVCKTYIDWAVKNEFAVIDVNIPRHYTSAEEENPIVPPLAESRRREDCSELADYLWSNYIEVGNSPKIFFMGIGNAYYGLTDLYKSKPDVLGAIDGSIGFVSENDIRGVSDPEDDRVARTYYAISTIFVAHDHPCWDPDRKKPKRRHGQLKRSGKNRLQEMLHAHRKEIWELLEASVAEWKNEQHVRAARDPQGVDRRVETIDDNNTRDQIEVDSRAMDVGVDARGSLNMDDTGDEHEYFISQVQPVKRVATPPVGFFPTTPTKR